MLLYPLMKRMGYGLSKRESVILTWGGLRGALGMTLALMVSYTLLYLKMYAAKYYFHSRNSYINTLRKCYYDTMVAE